MKPKIFCEKACLKKLLLLCQSTIHLDYLPVVSVQEILYSRCILGHKIAGFRASEGLPNKHECLGKIMLIMEIKF